jgi:hypothetical protein
VQLHCALGCVTLLAWPRAHSSQASICCLSFPFTLLLQRTEEVHSHNTRNIAESYVGPCTFKISCMNPAVCVCLKNKFYLVMSSLIVEFCCQRLSFSRVNYCDFFILYIISYSSFHSFDFQFTM